MRINTSTNNNTSFKGYDVIPLKGIYMQGLTKPEEKRIFDEMKKIAKEENIDLFLNENNTQISKKHKGLKADNKLSIWGQDRKAFVQNKDGKTILWSTDEKVLQNNQIKPLGNYKIDAKFYMPRGGNYYLGYKENGEKWLLINSMTIATQESFEEFGDFPTKKHLLDLFDIKPENLLVVDVFSRDLDEAVRPIGYPNILINDYEKSLENLEKMKEKYPESEEIYKKFKKHLTDLNDSPLHITKLENIKKLKQFGFNPITIGGYYAPEINFLNAIAYKNKKNNISYITNSTKHTTPYLKYLEELFEKDLKKEISNVKKIHFVSGGPNDLTNHIAKTKTTNDNNNIDLTLKSLYGLSKQQNTIMSILANRQGGIHCMSAEIPDFAKLPFKQTLFKNKSK